MTIPVYHTNELLVAQVGIDSVVTWANSDVVNTQKTSVIPSPVDKKQEYELLIYNPSTITDLSCKIFISALDLQGATRQALLATITIPKSQVVTGTTINTHSRLLHGLFYGGDILLVFSNDTMLGVADGFTASYRLIETAN